MKLSPSLPTAGSWLAGSLLAGFFLAASALNASAAARNIALSSSGSGQDAAFCSDDRAYCAQMRGKDTLDLQYNGASVAISGVPLGRNERAEPSSSVIEIAPGHILAGVIIERDEPIANGSFRRRDMLLWDIRFSDGSMVGPVLDVPVHSEVATRDDCRNWPQNAPRPCDASYTYNSRIDVLRATTDGYPVLTYRVANVIRPARASREFGWTDQVMISSDGSGIEERCDFMRSYSYNRLSGRYIVDYALPECDQFLEPNLLPRRAKPGITEVWMRDAMPAEVATYISPQTQSRHAAALQAPKYELGWIYNFLATGSDIVVMRVSDNGRCEGGDCELHFFGTRNCVEPALCRADWVQSFTGNRAYTVTQPEDPLDKSCPASLVLIPVGRDQGQYCLISKGVEFKGRLAADLTRNFPKE